MEDINILEYLLDKVDLLYIIICNVFTYIVLSPFTKLKTWWKRLISAGCAIVVAIPMHFAFGHGIEPLFYGFFLQFLTWDYIFKGIVKSISEKFNKKKTKEE